MLIDASGNIKLADFGISHQLQCDGDRVHKVIGTAQYMPPEAYIKNRGYNRKFDMWSLGCCLYEMVVGVPPFGLAGGTGGGEGLREEVVSSEIRMKDYFSKDFKDLLYCLLERCENTRLCIKQV